MSLNSIETPSIAGTPQAVFSAAISWLNEGLGAALATVTKTWGTAPRPLGSMLAICQDGRFEGSVSGGCIEGAVIKEAIEVIDDGVARSLTFGISDEQAWEVGLTCGGEITVHIRKVSSASYLEDLAAQAPTVLALNLETGAEHLMGSSSFPSSLLETAQQALQNDTSQDLADSPYFLQVFNHPLRMIIVGAVHISQALAPMATQAGFQVTVVDPRRAYATPERFPGTTLMNEWPNEAFEILKPDTRTAVVMVCHDSKIDDPALENTLKSKAYYIGALGSRRTQQKRRERLIGLGFSETDLARICGPIGLDLGGRSHGEIAVSILAEAIATRHGKMLRNDA